MNEKDKLDYRLYLVTDRSLVGSKDFYQSIEEAILGGVTLLQLREKTLSSRDFYNTAKKVREITKIHSVPFIINDRLDIALAVNADGLHIGQEDLPVETARKLLGPNKLIGVSASTIDEAISAEKGGADYLGVGAIFPTGTKDNAKSVDIEQLRKIKQAVSIPVVAIGGINEKNVQIVMHADVDGVSIVSAILAKEDVKQAANKLLGLVEESRKIK